MPKIIFKMIAYGFLGITITGCASVKARTYVEDKERVDQEMAGNAGFIRGEAPPGQERVPVRSTRKVYVLEVTKENPSETVALDKPSSVSMPSEKPSQNFTSKDDGDMNHSQLEQSSGEQVRPTGLDSPDVGSLQQMDSINLPSDTNSFAASWSPVALPTQYTVTKDDTMQSISKKFYNSYSKWPKIYEVNKDKILDPNRIKPGLILTIPEI